MWWETHVDVGTGPATIPVPAATAGGAPGALVSNDRSKRRRVDSDTSSDDGAAGTAAAAAAPAPDPNANAADDDDAEAVVGTLRVLQWAERERAALYRSVRRLGIGRCLREPEVVRAGIPTRSMLDVLHVLGELGSAASELRADELADQQLGTVTRLDRVETGLVSPIVVTTAASRGGNLGRGRDRRVAGRPGGQAGGRTCRTLDAHTRSWNEQECIEISDDDGAPPPPPPSKQTVDAIDAAGGAALNNSDDGGAQVEEDDDDDDDDASAVSGTFTVTDSRRLAVVHASEEVFAGVSRADIRRVNPGVLATLKAANRSWRHNLPLGTVLRVPAAHVPVATLTYPYRPTGPGSGKVAKPGLSTFGEALGSGIAKARRSIAVQ